jgi:hypothetical protein
MSNYIHRTKYELLESELNEPASIRLLSGIALTLLLLISGAILYSLTSAQNRTAQSIILSDFATLNLEAAQGRVEPPTHSASLPFASRFE